MAHALHGKPQNIISLLLLSHDHQTRVELFCRMKCCLLKPPGHHLGRDPFFPHSVHKPLTLIKQLRYRSFHKTLHRLIKRERLSDINDIEQMKIPVETLCESEAHLRDLLVRGQIRTDRKHTTITRASNDPKRNSDLIKNTVSQQPLLRIPHQNHINMLRSNLLSNDRTKLPFHDLEIRDDAFFFKDGFCLKKNDDVRSPRLAIDDTFLCLFFLKTGSKRIGTFLCLSQCFFFDDIHNGDFASKAFRQERSFF